MKKLSLFIVVLLFAGCSSVQDQNVDAEKNEATDLMSMAENADFVSYPMGQPASSKVENYRWGTLEGKEKETARKKWSKISSKAIGAFSVILPIVKKSMEEDSNISADELTASVQDHLDKYQDREETFLTEQYIASAILLGICKNYTLKSNLDKCRNEKLSGKNVQMLNYATSLFVKNANPNADLIAFNLEKLEGSISDKTLEYYASETIKSSKAWYSSDDLCVECSSSNAPRNLNRRTQLVQQGITDLKKYIN